MYLNLPTYYTECKMSAFWLVLSMNRQKIGVVGRSRVGMLLQSFDQWQAPNHESSRAMGASRRDSCRDGLCLFYKRLVIQLPAPSNNLQQVFQVDNRCPNTVSFGVRKQPVLVPTQRLSGVAQFDIKLCKLIRSTPLPPTSESFHSGPTYLRYPSVLWDPIGIHQPLSFSVSGMILSPKSTL